MKRLTLTILLCLLFAAHASARQRQTDAEADGLQGAVKSVAETTATLTQASGKLVESAPKPKSEVTYDPEGGHLARKSYDHTGALSGSTKYGRVDGDKVATIEEVRNPNILREIIPPTPGQAAPRADPRYTYRFKYKYDDAGNVAEEMWYHRDGSPYLKYVYRRKDNRREELVYSPDGSLNQKYVYVLDDKGRAAELLVYDVETNKVESKEKYEYAAFDAQGNWTKMITSRGGRRGRFALVPSNVTYRLITYY